MRMKTPVVLVVEDYPFTREMMCLLLGILGYDVLAAETGERAVALARENKPDMVLMDINLPDMDGFQAASLIRRQPSNKKVPIIACTALNRIDWHTQALNAGCNDLICKPLNFDELEQLLHSYAPLSGAA